MKIKHDSPRLVRLIFVFVLLIPFIGISDNEGLSKSQYSISIEKPRLYETLIGTSDYTIKWTHTELGDQQIRITLIDVQNNKEILTITDSYTNTGSFKWHVPVSLKTGGYRIRIKALPKNISTDSKVFTIKNPDIAQAQPTLQSPTSASAPSSPESMAVQAIQPTFGDNHDLQISSFYLVNNKLLVQLRNNGESYFSGPVDFYIKLVTTYGSSPEKTKTLTVNLGPRSQKEMTLLQEPENFLKSYFQYTCSLKVEITIDHRGKIPETNEGNNRLSRTLSSDKLYIDNNRVTAGARNLQVHNGSSAIITLYRDVYEERTPDKKYFKIRIAYKVENCSRERMLSFRVEQWWSIRLPGGSAAGLMSDGMANVKDLVIGTGGSQDIVMESRLPQSELSNDYTMELFATNKQTNERYKLFTCSFELRTAQGL